MEDVKGVKWVRVRFASVEARRGFEEGFERCRDVFLRRAVGFRGLVEQVRGIQIYDKEC